LAFSCATVSKTWIRRLLLWVSSQHFPGPWAIFTAWCNIMMVSAWVSCTTAWPWLLAIYWLVQRDSSIGLLKLIPNILGSIIPYNVSSWFVCTPPNNRYTLFKVGCQKVFPRKT
jgi:hypothetical protein